MRSAFRPRGVSVLAKLWKLFTCCFSIRAGGDDLGEVRRWQLSWSKRWKIKDKGITQGLKWDSGIPTAAGEPCFSLPASSITWAWRKLCFPRGKKVNFAILAGGRQPKAASPCRLVQPPSPCIMGLGVSPLWAHPRCVLFTPPASFSLPGARELSCRAARGWGSTKSGQRWER